MNSEDIIVSRSDDIQITSSDREVDLIQAFLQRFDRTHTRRAYKTDLSHFFGTSTVPIDLVRQATFVHINEYIVQLEDRGLKPSTIKRKVAAIRGFFDWLEALKLISDNPAKRQLLRRVRRVSRQDSPIVILTAHQASVLLDVASDMGEASVRNVTLIETMLHCLLRRSEAAAMNFEDVKPLGRHWILELPDTKGGSDQYVKIPSHVVDRINDHSEHYGITTGPLWLSLSNNSRGRRLSAHAIYSIVKKVSEIAGLSNIGAHTLRHTGCTLAIEAGASLQQVQTHARHNNIETTMVYIHQRDRLRDSAADFIHVKMDEPSKEKSE